MSAADKTSLAALLNNITLTNGKITGIVDPHKVTKEQVGILMTGGSIDA